ncbi:6-phosphogluconolactonase [Sphingobacterium hungaricum]
MSELNNQIHVFSSAKEAGEAAGKAVEQHLVHLQQEKKSIRMIFAAAPSQQYLLAYLANSKRIKWEEITAFNMDEYVGLQKDASQLFSKFLDDHLFSKVNLHEVHTIGTQDAIEEEIVRYTALINEDVIDVVCLGIGENGHLAFNDPPVADFEDSETVKLVELDLVCRQQQVNDKCFAEIADVPKTALTLSIPALLRGEALFCVVVGKHKAEAVNQAIYGPIDSQWPATILRKHDHCQYYFDTLAFPS